MVVAFEAPEPKTAIELGAMLSQLNEITVLVEDCIGLTDAAPNLRGFGNRLFEFGLPRQVQSVIVSGSRAPDDVRSRYQLFLLNWGLVMSWTSFEASMSDLLLFTFTFDDRTFMNWGSDRSITFRGLGDLTTVAAAKEIIIRKRIRDFMSEGIEERVKQLSAKFNVPISALFRHSLSVQARNVQLAPEVLSEIAKARNQIVHEERFPITTLEQFKTDATVLGLFLANLAQEISKKISVPVRFPGGLTDGPRK